MITKENYEAFLLDRAEGCLSKEAERELNVFLSEHPELDDDFTEWNGDIKFEYSTNAEFSRKNNLFKPVFTVPKRVKAAAVVLIIVSVSYFAYTFFDNAPQQGPVAKTDTHFETPLSENTASASHVNTVKTHLQTLKPQKTTVKQHFIATNTQKDVPQLQTEETKPHQEEAISEEKTSIAQNNVTDRQTTDSEQLNIIVYSPSDREESQNLIAYVPSEPNTLQKLKNKVTQVINKINV